jgi:hypothetical protein
MCDGSPLVKTVALTSYGGVLADFPLYAGKGALSFETTIDVHMFFPEDESYWYHPPSATYPAGFDVELYSDASRYNAAISPQPPLPKSVITIKGGNLSVIGLSSTVTFDINGKGTVLAGGDIAGLTLNVARSTGAITGSFIPPGSTKSVSIEAFINFSSYSSGFTLVPGTPFVLPSLIEVRPAP